MTRLRVMTYNVRQLKDDRAAVVRVLRAAAPDVVALQEPPRGPLGGRRMRRLAEEAGLERVVAGGPARTTALLARPGLTVTGAWARALPWRPVRTRRGISVADVDGVRVISIHLGLSAAERDDQVTRILHVVRAAPGVGCVVAGDLNELPTGRNWRRLCRTLRDATPSAGPTFPATAPASRIDGVFAVGGFVATGAGVVEDEDTRRASDHLPVVVDLEWS